MKKQLLIIPAIALLASCGGGNTNQNNGTATDTTATVETPQCDVSTDTESEPADTISTKVWEALLAFDKKLKERIDEFKREPRFENPNGKSTSKTTYEFSCIYHSEEGGEEIIMGAKLGCFPMPDKSWMVVMVPANIYEHNNIRAYNYSDGKVTKADIDKVFPEGFELLANVDYPDFNDYKIDASTFSAELPAQWPLKYEWKGSEFRPAQTIYEPYTTDMSDGSFNCVDMNPIRINSPVDDLHSDVAKSGEVKNASGKTLVKLDIKDKHVVGYSIVDPLVAISEEDNLEAGTPYIVYYLRPLCYPVTIGMPIKDVLNYKKGNKMKDKNITQGNKDGKYVITQQLSHTDFAGNTYIEFSAPDQNAKITGIRVYFEPLKFDYKRDILQNSKFNTLTLNALKAANLDLSKYGKVTGGKIDDTGFSIYFEGDVSTVEFRTYSDDKGCLVAYAIFDNPDWKFITENVKYWHFSDGKLTAVEPTFPNSFSDCMRWAKGDGDMTFAPDGIFFSLSEDERLFKWTGEEFEEGYREYSYEGEE